MSLQEAKRLLDEYLEKLNRVREEWSSYRERIIENLVKAIKEKAKTLKEDQLLKLSNMGYIRFPSLTKVEFYVNSRGDIVFGDTLLNLRRWLDNYIKNPTDFKLLLLSLATSETVWKKEAYSSKP